MVATVASTSAGRDDRARAEPVRVTDRPADDAAQHVAALLVARDDAVGDEEGHRAGVLGEDAERHVGLGAGERAVGGAGEPFGRGDQRPEDVDVPHGVDALEDREVALEAGAGVDARRRQRHLAYRRACASNCMNTRFQISTKRSSLTAGPPPGPCSGPRSQKISELYPHGPVSAIFQRLVSSPRRWIARQRQADGLVPDRLGLVVGVVHRDPEPIRVEPEDLGVELPGPAGSPRP